MILNKSLEKYAHFLPLQLIALYLFSASWHFKYQPEDE